MGCTSRSPSSDRKITAETFVQRRAQTLPNERRFRREIGVIVQKPPSHQLAVHEEIWTEADPEWKWDGERELNLDEVPWANQLRPKLLVAGGERSQLVAEAMRGLDKYRKGTILLVVNPFRLLLVILIFRRGGAQISARLRNMQNDPASIVLPFVTHSGSMTSKLWVVVMDILQKRTKAMRGCLRPDGMDWRRALALSFDNFGSHGQSAVAENLAAKHGIYCRALMRNASHFEQAVDQHIGAYSKTVFKEAMLHFSLMLRRAFAAGFPVKINFNKYREICVRYANRMVDRVCWTSVGQCVVQLLDNRWTVLVALFVWCHRSMHNQLCCANLFKTLESSANTMGVKMGTSPLCIEILSMRPPTICITLPKSQSNADRSVRTLSADQCLI